MITTLKKIHLLAIVYTLLLCLGLLILQPVFLQKLVDHFADWQLTLLPVHDHPDKPIIVTVDEKSLQALGQWPWPRYQTAELVEAISAAAPRTLTIDAIFAEPDQTSLNNVLDKLSSRQSKSVTLPNIDVQYLDNDKIFAAALNKPNIVTPYFFQFAQRNRQQVQYYAEGAACFPQTASAAFVDKMQTGLQKLYVADAALCNRQEFLHESSRSGFTNAMPDLDGLYRRIPLLIVYKGRIFPSLALQTYLIGQGQSQFVVKSTVYGFDVEVNGQRIPVDAHGQLFLNFKQAENNTMPPLSAIDVLQNPETRARLSNRDVLIGFSAIGLTEYRSTPVNRFQTGVELHQSVLENLYASTKLIQPKQHLLYAYLAGTLLFVVLALLFIYYSNVIAILLWPLSLAVLVFFASQMLLFKTGVLLPALVPMLMLAILMGTIVLTRYVHSYFKEKRTTAYLKMSQQAIIQTICSMSEYRDPETANHIVRTQNYVLAIARELRKLPKYGAQLTDEALQMLYEAAPLHDIGKIGIPDSILLSSGNLSPEDIKVMKTHPEIGARIMSAVAKYMPPNRFLMYAQEITACHHERWDGSGYPAGLKGEDIPLSARIMTVADVYDALISKRVYKPAYPHYYALERIQIDSGIQFDPEVVQAMLSIEDKIIQIALSNLDTAEQRATLMSKEPPNLSQRDVAYVQRKQALQKATVEKQ